MLFTHAMPVKSVWIFPGGVGLLTIDQRFPSHRSVSVLAHEAVVSFPTAAQLVPVGHEIALKVAKFSPGGFGLATIDHLDPFHSSISVLDQELFE